MVKSIKMTIFGESINHNKFTVFPPYLGIPSMKSIEIYVQILVGMGKGSSKPRRSVVSPLLRWKVSHSATVC